MSTTREPFHLHVYGPRQGSADENSPSHSPIEASFEEATERLLHDIPAVLIEPDGSIAWASPSHQIVGIIYDAGAVIRYVELRGFCTPSQLIRLVATIAGAPKVGDFAVMRLPIRQWNNLQQFANSLTD
ncbi:MAG: hypothetical protein AAGJ83_05675 [Planctomycetota bacterium]